MADGDLLIEIAGVTKDYRALRPLRVQHLALHHSAASTALALDNIPIAMFFAVFEAPVEPQEHANQLTQNKTNEKRLGLHYRRFANEPL